MKLVSHEEMKSIDKAASRQFGIPSIVLMENAGNAVFQYVRENIPDYGNKKYLIFCGAGNNGGDGAVVARKLFMDGVYVKVIFVSDLSKATGDAKTNFDILMSIGVPFDIVMSDEDWDRIKQTLFHHHIVVDAIFGIGFHGDIEGHIRSAVQFINTFKKIATDKEPRVIALDIPSGIYSNGGISNVAVQADVTLTMALPKIGMIDYPARDWIGTLVVMDINIPRDLLKDWNLRNNLLTEEHVRRIYTRRKRNSHKGTYGHLLIIAGQTGMSGAAVIASQAALRSGVGLLTVAIPDSIAGVVAASVPEAMTMPMDMVDRASAVEMLDGFIRERSVRAILIGNGMGKGDTQKAILERLAASHRDIPLVIDADGLNILASDRKLFQELPKEGRKVIITPHVGEMARLIERDVEFVKQFKTDAARDLAVKNGFIVVLKDSVSVVAYPDGQVWLSEFGSPALAKGGSGDALAGIIAGLVTCGPVSDSSPLIGVYILGTIGDRYEKRHSSQSMLASDIVQFIPEIFHSLEISE